MPHTLAAQGIIAHNLPVIPYLMSCYDTLDDPEFAPEHGELLHHRSALELVRDQLSDAQCLELEQIDKHWRDNAALFNHAFKPQHACLDRTTALAGYITDPTGRPPTLPTNHWWWHPIDKTENTK